MKSSQNTFRFIFGFLFCLMGIGMSHISFAQSDNANDNPSEQFVSIDFNDVDINVFVKFISELTGTNFVIDERVRGKVTIISPAKISVKEAFRVFESVLEVHGFTTVKAGEVTKIIPQPEARSKSIETLLKEEIKTQDDRIITQLVPLKYADPSEIKKLFAPLISKNSIILDYAPTKTLIITDVHSNIQRLLHILKTIDVSGVGLEISIIPLEYAEATKFVTLLQSIFKEGRRTQVPPGEESSMIQFVADERTNTIVLLASEDDAIKIKKLITMLDKEVPRGEEKIRVYFLENSTAEELAKVIQTLSTQQNAGAQGAKRAPIISENVKITADKATNSLIIVADKNDYVVLEEIIKQLDIPRQMVYIEALIMEVNVDKDFILGAEWIAGGEMKNNNKEGVYGGGFSGGNLGSGDSGYNVLSPSVSIGGVTASAPPLPPGFSLGIFSETLTIGSGSNKITFPNLGAVVKAYKKDKDVHILSTPQILTTDNEEAKIHVGKNVPFQTGTTISTTSTISSIEYKDVGKTLKITPSISKDRLVRLKISLEVTDLESTTDFRPTTLKRTVDTTVIVKDTNTIVIGGLIDDSFSKIHYKVPCLGEIPGLGALFSNISDSNTKTNLYVFLTPHVVGSPTEATTLYENKKDQMNQIKAGEIKIYEKSTPGTKD